MTRPLKHLVREYLGERALDEEQLRHLLGLPAAGQASPTAAPARPRHWLLPVAALALVALVAGVLLLMPGEGGNMPRRIAAEVVKNHLHMKPLEAEAAQVEALRPYFTELDFVPRHSHLLARSGLDLKGARYCSLQGVTAAQLRLVDRAGRLQTLYQVPYEPELFSRLPRLEDGEPPLEVHVSGIKVRIWVEQGILFALTADAGA